MKQATFFDDAWQPVIHPVVSPSPDPVARACSDAGAKKIAPHIGELHERAMNAYRLMGPMTDQELADFLGIERTTAIPRRTELMAVGQVRRVGVKKNENTGISNMTYGLV